MIEIYYAAPSIYGRKVLAVLQEKNLDFELKKMSFAAKDHHKEDYLKLNPNGEVPTLVDDGQVIYESTAICEYLDEEYPNPPLMPVDSFSRAKVRMIEDFIDLHLSRAIIKVLIKRRKKEEVSPEETQGLKTAMERVEVYLGDGEFLAGGEFSLADCAFMPAAASLEPLGFGELLETPRIKPYFERLKKRAGYKGASLLELD